MGIIGKGLAAIGLVVVVGAGVAAAKAGPERIRNFIESHRGEGMRGGMMGGHGPAMMFGKLDADGNGTVTRQEVAGFIDQRFLSADVNRDGFIDAAEVKGMLWFTPHDRSGRLMAILDLDGDGKISRAEVDKQVGKVFAVFDRNDDGEITEAELSVLSPGGHGGRGQGGGRMHGPDGGPGQGGMERHRL